MKKCKIHMVIVKLLVAVVRDSESNKKFENLWWSGEKKEMEAGWLCSSCNCVCGVPGCSVFPECNRVYRLQPRESTRVFFPRLLRLCRLGTVGRFFFTSLQVREKEGELSACSDFSSRSFSRCAMFLAFVEVPLEGEDKGARARANTVTRGAHATGYLLNGNSDVTTLRVIKGERDGELSG